MLLVSKGHSCRKDDIYGWKQSRWNGWFDNILKIYPVMYGTHAAKRIRTRLLSKRLWGRGKIATLVGMYAFVKLPHMSLGQLHVCTYTNWECFPQIGVFFLRKIYISLSTLVLIFVIGRMCICCFFASPFRPSCVCVHFATQN